MDDRPDPTPPLDLEVTDDRISVVTSGGRGPAAARNAGWRASTAPWIAFVDDDVQPPLGWVRSLTEDVHHAEAHVAAVQGRVEVPLPADRAPTDWERNVAGLDGATWITADMAVRRAALEAVGGFDERFRRAYREDTDLALRLLDAGWTLTLGTRRVRHPVRPAGPWTSVRLQRGNADDVLLERLHGAGWRARVGVSPGAWQSYPLTTALGVTAVAALVARRPRMAVVAGALWAARTGRFAWRRTAPGPRTATEVATMLATSVAIPPVGLLPPGTRPPAVAIRASAARVVSPTRIAVVRALPGLGDLLCAVPALTALRAAHPEAEVTLVGLPSASWFVDAHPALVDDLLPVVGVPGLPEIEPDPAAARRFHAAAADRRFDLALQLHGSGVTTNPLTTMLGARDQVCAARGGPLAPARHGGAVPRRGARGPPPAGGDHRRGRPHRRHGRALVGRRHRSRGGRGAARRPGAGRRALRVHPPRRLAERQPVARGGLRRRGRPAGRGGVPRRADRLGGRGAADRARSPAP